MALWEEAVTIPFIQKKRGEKGAATGEVRLRHFALKNERFEHDAPIRKDRDKDSGVKTVSKGKT